jgi:hypothetical protein
MKARKIDGVTYRSNSDYAKYLLMNSPKTLMSDGDIARLAKIRPQTVHAIKMKMLGLK